MMRFAPLFLAAMLAAVPAVTCASEPDPPGSSLAERAQEVALQALGLLGVNYRYGGREPESGFDCSGLVRYVYRQALGLDLPHNAAAISRLGRQVGRDELQPGDLVFFNTLRRAFSHVGVYIGDNRFVHAASRVRGEVEMVSLSDPYWAHRFDGARRLIGD